MERKTLFEEMDLTSGKLFWKLPLFSLPMAFTTILQLLYTTIDLYTVAEYGGGNNSMSAVGSNSALINLIVAFFVSIAVGANVALGNAKGANRKDTASKVLHTSLIFSLFIGVFVGVLGFFLAPYLLKLMGTPDSIIDNATIYLKIYFIGAPFLLVYNFGSQCLRAIGDSQRPLYILFISGAVNIAFDLIFVICFKMDVMGVAIATIMSEAVSAILTVLWLCVNKKGYVRIRWKEMKIDRFCLNNIIRIGLPAGVQALGFNIPNVLIQSSLYTISNYSINGVLISQDEIVAGSSASSQIEGYVYAFIDAVAMACISFVGQNYGAKKKENIRKIFWYSMIWMMIFWGVCALVVLLIPYQILGVFITQSETVKAENALEAGKERMFLMIFTYWLDGIMDVAGQYLRGMKKSTAPALITLFGVTGSRILFLYTLFQLDYFHTIFWLYFTYPLSWAIVDLIYMPVTIVLERKVFKTFDEGNQTPQQAPIQ